ncbi:hypothetical protein PC120_g19530, partial [Phytophthora cactorum]
MKTLSLTSWFLIWSSTVNLMLPSGVTLWLIVWSLDGMLAEFDGLLSTTELDEYLEEFGYDGDEETVGVWDRILGATRSNSANGNGERTGADINSAEGADSIPAADRREFPGDNEPDFPQEKHLSGIRARKTTWHLLLVVPRELKVGSRSTTLLPAEASTDKTELRKHIGCKALLTVLQQRQQGARERFVVRVLAVLRHGLLSFIVAFDQ